MPYGIPGKITTPGHDGTENTEICNIEISYALRKFCILIKLYTTNFQGKRNILRCAPPEQEKSHYEPGMEMLTAEVSKKQKLENIKATVKLTQVHHNIRNVPQSANL